MDDYLQKPLNVELFRTTVARWLWHVIRSAAGDASGGGMSGFNNLCGNTQIRKVL